MRLRVDVIEMQSSAVIKAQLYATLLWFHSMTSLFSMCRDAAYSAMVYCFIEKRDRDT